MFKDSTIVFDLDGTLVDTAPDLSNALNDVLTRRGHQPVSPETIRACVGHGARVMIEEALRRAGAEDDVDRMLAEFLVHYEANIAAESRPFPGAVAALEAFAAQGAILAVCTNKRESLSRRLLQELGIDGYFAAIAGRDTFAVSKPDPGHLTGTIALAGGDPVACRDDRRQRGGCAHGEGRRHSHYPCQLRLRDGPAARPFAGRDDRPLRCARGSCRRPPERCRAQPFPGLNA